MNAPKPTPPPWRVHEQGEPNQYCLLTDGPTGPGWVLGLIHNGEMTPAQQRANLDFIAQAVNSHAALLAACESLHDALSNILEGCNSPKRGDDGIIHGEMYSWIHRDQRAQAHWAIRKSFKALIKAKGTP